ncbi:MAG: adenosylmethionine--8-amino-7-oxononanoate transaminase [Rhodocyclaceae bacterium]|nr:adenosylmethionine--8-amino-7-oxononanoate transaminase [Rhodocyclaceae bacterium]
MSNADLLKRSLAAVWHPCTQMKQHAHDLPLVPVVRGEGLWLYDADGRRYLDAISSWWVNLFGHCNPRINAALADQLGKLEHVILAGFTHEPVVQLSERLSALTDHGTGERLGHCFYASDGASATEIALKMSFHFWQNSGRPQKREFVALAGGYHGETVGALAVTDVAIFRDAYAPLIRAAHVVPSPDARLAEAGETAADVARRAAAALEAFLAANHERIAALIVEPLVQGAAGMAMHDPEYLRRARALCDRYAVHLICDEIAVGCGRTGTFFAHEQAGIQPDFLCLSKGISGGYLPLSVVLTTDAVYAAFYDDATVRGFLHSHSYTGNALACRAALATLDIFAADDVLARNQARGDRLETLLAPLAAHEKVRHFRRRGMILAFDVDADSGFGRRFYREALARELLLRPMGNTVYVMPPYILGDDDAAFVAAGAAAALEAALK